MKKGYGTMKKRWVLACLLFLGCGRAEAAPYIDDTVADQWFTGSLESPSPAIPKAGILAIEPYVIYGNNTGAYDSNWNHHSVENGTDQLASVILLKYAITDQISFQGVPSFSRQWNDHSSSNGVSIGDLPLEFDYRVNNENRKTGLPSATFSLGMNLPTGSYDRLHTPLDGVGSGAYSIKEGLLLQSLFDTWGNHPVRFRLWGTAYEPVANVNVHGTSVYGTGQGFQGHATPGFSSQIGLGTEYGLDQRWVVAIDFVQNFAAASDVNGTDGPGNAVHTNSGASTTFAVAPALEYNLSSTMGIIAGVEVSAAGRNSSSYIAPNIALSMVF
jgi:hypothetical protein